VQAALHWAPYGSSPRAAVGCALLSRDDRLFTDYVAWTRGLLAARDMVDMVVRDGLAVLHDVRGSAYPASQGLIGTATRHG
jgi:hypothetical protein